MREGKKSEGGGLLKPPPPDRIWLRPSNPEDFAFGKYDYYTTDEKILCARE